MSARIWTEEQKKAIECRNRNILVSAAAGSGKTAVLVERIVEKISSTERPVDIDRLLVVTFTNAAAGEMKERVGQAIEERIEREPDNSYLQKQISLLHSAQITTIHSFCLDLLRNHFNVIDLDPAFRLGEEAELLLLKSDVLSEVLEEAYKEGEEGFLQFVEAYAPGKSDLPIEQLVMRLYEFSMGYPWPKKWLSQVLEEFLPQSAGDLEQQPFVKEMLHSVEKLGRDAYRYAVLAKELSLEDGGPYMYLDCLEKEEAMLERLCGCESLGEYASLLSNISFGRLSSKKDEAVDKEKRELVKYFRGCYKDCIEEIREDYLSQSLDEIYEELLQLYPHMQELIGLTLRYMEALKKEKEERNLLDFDDLEHYALQILVKDEKPTPVALELREYYEEILIDEYQDSNQVQETLLKAVSKEEAGAPNRFMVGDVKQSIYKFRLARPELFMEKYASYSKEEGLFQRIDLHKNFRSRSIVLEGTNYIFEGIMHSSLGGVEYDEDAHLRAGADFPDISGNMARQVDVILAQDDEALLEDAGSRELEAEAAAYEIHKLMEQRLMIWDQGSCRLAGYGDIVILLRTMSGYSDVFVETLKERGIPAYAETSTGYFSAAEVVKTLQFLLIIDNPLQDIPFAAVLHSYMGGMEDEELAALRLFLPETSWYARVGQYGKEGENPVLAEKCRSFSKLLESFRDMVPYASVYELLVQIYEQTGYYDYVSVLPDGRVRRGNLDMLLQKAADFEKSSYQGLFHFNRYIEKLHQYEIDFGEANTESGSMDAVRIMSIHKSKGLEFPVVLLCGMSKRFNLRDTREAIIFHPDLGIGADLANAAGRKKHPTRKKKVIQHRMAEESLGEELRVLYVAMTRAKEKLIFMGTVKGIDKQLQKWNQKQMLLYRDLMGALSYFDWIMPRILPAVNAAGNGLFHVEERTAKELALEQVEKTVKSQEIYQVLTQWHREDYENPQIAQALDTRLSSAYPYEKWGAIKAKVTVTELKRQQLPEEEELLGDALFSRQEEAYVPSFAKENQEITAAGRGTVYHKVLEHLRLSQLTDAASLRAQLSRLEEEGRLTKEEQDVIWAQDLLKFLASPLGRRMARAEKEGRLYRERPFVYGVLASEVYGPEFEAGDEEETVLIQGVIDVYFEEEKGLVLMDYKTDRVESEQELVVRYQPQLEYYKEALWRMTGQRVAETWIYSFCLGKEILV